MGFQTPYHLALSGFWIDREINERGMSANECEMSANECGHEGGVEYAPLSGFALGIRKSSIFLSIDAIFVVILRILVL